MNAPGVIDHIVNWLASYCRDARQKGFVIGISGGIDSAVTSALCARTGLPALCVELPIHQHEREVERARDHITFLKARHKNVRSVEVELTAVFDRLVEQLPVVENEDLKQLALANTRARLRMTSLYHLAGSNHYLVAGTGNKVEDLGVGFFTKYGDGGVDISPIADLYKSEVYSIGRELGIVQSILEAAPTDGLWGDERSDADQIGATYPELEWAMELRSRSQEVRPKELSDRQRIVLSIYDRMHAANRHKMVPIPICGIPAELR